MTVRVAERSDKYAALLALADVFDRSGEELRAMTGLGADILGDDAVAESAELSPASHAGVEDDVRAATTGRHGLLSRSVELDADALVVRATVLTYQWIDELRETAYQTLGAVAGRAIGYLAPTVALGGAIVTAGLIETDALDRDGVAAYLEELMATNPELLDHVVTGGGGLLDGLQMRSALTPGLLSGESGRRAARAGLRVLGVEPMRQDSSAALRDVAGGLLTGADAVRPALGDAPGVPVSLADLVATAESVDGGVLVQRTAPGRYIAYVGAPPPGPAPDDSASVRLVTGDPASYAAAVARTIATAVADDDRPHVMVVGAAAGGVVAAELAAAHQRALPFVVDQVVTAGAPGAHVPRLPGPTRMLALEDRADPVALLGSLVNADDPQRTTVVFDTAGSSAQSVYVAGARAADASPAVAEELDRLRALGYLASV